VIDEVGYLPIDKHGADTGPDNPSRATSRKANSPLQGLTVSPHRPPGPSGLAMPTRPFRPHALPTRPFRLRGSVCGPAKRRWRR
jgi:hypothetical protein